MNNETKGPLEKHKILFQNLGGRWYAFAEIEGKEVIYTALPKGVDPKTTKLEFYELIEDHLHQVSFLTRKKKRPEMAA